MTFSLPEAKKVLERAKYDDNYSYLSLISPVLKSYVLDITPSMALHMLSFNKNRPLQGNNLPRIHDEFKANNCVFSQDGNSLKFSMSGALKDGQYRLISVVLSGETLKAVVAVGCDETLQNTLAICTKMPAAESYRNVFKNPTSASAVINAAFFLKRGNRTTSAREGEAFIEKNDVKDIEKAIEIVGNCKTVTKSQLGLFYLGLLKAGYPESKIRVFNEKLSKGTSLTEKDAIRKLREKWAGNNRPANNLGGVQETITGLCWAWTKFYKNEAVTKMVIPKKALTVTNFDFECDLI
jgi:hypothetical protein